MCKKDENETFDGILLKLWLEEGSKCLVGTDMPTLEHAKSLYEKFFRDTSAIMLDSTIVEPVVLIDSGKMSYIVVPDYYEWDVEHLAYMIRLMELTSKK